MFPEVRLDAMCEAKCAPRPILETFSKEPMLTVCTWTSLDAPKPSKAS